MPVQFKYGLLADYITLGANGKPIIIGVFDRIRPHPSAPRSIPTFHLIAHMECSLADGSIHEVRLSLRDGNDAVVEREIKAPHTFGTAGPGYPLVARIIMQVVGLELDAGDYTFVLHVDDVRLGDVPFVVLDPGRLAASK